jgi:DNA-binding FadR family transcriptional regulator
MALSNSNRSDVRARLDAIDPVVERTNGPAPRAVKTGEVVANHLRRRIARGELAIGEQLPPEEELTAVFGVARTTLREALRILESQQLISIRRGRGGGPVVTMPSIDSLAVDMAVILQLHGTTIGDLERARTLIEPKLAADLAASHTDEDLAALEAAVEAAAEHSRRGDHQGFALAAAEVHNTLVQRAGNTTLAMFSRLLHHLIEQYYAMNIERASIPLMQRAVRSYRKLLRLIESSDVEGTELHWRRQMAYTIATRDPDARLDAFASDG